ncbi:MAG: histidine phosphatase family protein [Oscillospiraceae bacterium]|nr:histidine phosphatase family protein [Oscillospiraceae bacterium]
MRYVYLIRHAMPDIPIGERWCVGRTDLPLGTVGRMQAALLPFVPELRDKPVFCSRLSRAIDTARPLCPEPGIREGLEEQDMGVWDGLSFTEIKSLYPELYAAREHNPYLWPEGAESMESVGRRMRAALLRCLEETGDDIVVVSHKSAIDSITGSRPKLLHTSVSVVAWDGRDLIPLEIGRLPHPDLSEEVCMAVLDADGTPEHVVAHCRAVAAEALRLAELVPAEHPPMDRELLYAAAMLHDIARTEPRHAEAGAAWIRALGYPEVAEVVAQHHDLASDSLDEAALLYLADKYIQGEQRVTLEERFAKSAERCSTAEARAAHERRLNQARSIEKQLCRR